MATTTSGAGTHFYVGKGVRFRKAGAEREKNQLQAAR